MGRTLTPSVVGFPRLQGTSATPHPVVTSVCRGCTVRDLFGLKRIDEANDIRKRRELMPPRDSLEGPRGQPIEPVETRVSGLPLQRRARNIQRLDHPIEQCESLRRRQPAKADLQVKSPQCCRVNQPEPVGAHGEHAFIALHLCQQFIHAGDLPMALGALAMLRLVAPTIEVFFLTQAVASATQTALAGLALTRALPPSTQPARFRLQVLREHWRFAAGMLGIALLSVILTQVDKMIVTGSLTLRDCLDGKS